MNYYRPDDGDDVVANGQPTEALREVLSYLSSPEPSFLPDRMLEVSEDLSLSYLHHVALKTRWF